MYPSIRSGDFVWVEIFGNEDIPKVGEVLFFKDHNGGLVMHRLIEIGCTDKEGEKIFVTKGDGHGGRIDRVLLPEILGRVTGVERRGFLYPISPKGPSLAQKGITFIYFCLVQLKENWNKKNVGDCH